MSEMNESYYLCLDQLRTRYRGRGVATNMAISEKKNAENYILTDSRAGIGDTYRSGVYNGARYMTSEDFVRYFKTRREFNMPEALRQKQKESEVLDQTSLPTRRIAGRGIRESSDSKEGHLQNLLSALKSLREKWLPIEPTEGRAESGRLRLPAAAMSGLAVFTLSLGLIVGGSVMLGSASGEVGRLNSEISVLEATNADLEGKLDLKYNINELEADAKSLGMIKREHADNQYIPVEGDDEVIVYEDNKDKNVGLGALLAAFGIEID